MARRGQFTRKFAAPPILYVFFSVPQNLCVCWWSQHFERSSRNPYFSWFNRHFLCLKPLEAPNCFCWTPDFSLPPASPGAVPAERQPPRAVPQRPSDPAAPPRVGWQLLHHTGGHGVSGPEASKRVLIGHSRTWTMVRIFCGDTLWPMTIAKWVKTNQLLEQLSCLRNQVHFRFMGVIKYR